MEHFIRIAFWIVALGACLLQVSPAPLIEISDWRTEPVNCSDSVFYIPTDVKDECFLTALNCIMAELNGTAKIECKNSGDRIDNHVDVLSNIISELIQKKKLTLNNSTECDCHRWSEGPLDEFLESVKDLFQKINSQV